MIHSASPLQAGCGIRLILTSWEIRTGNLCENSDHYNGRDSVSASWIKNSNAVPTNVELQFAKLHCHLFKKWTYVKSWITNAWLRLVERD